MRCTGITTNSLKYIIENLRDTLEELNLLGFGKHWWKDFLDWSQLKSMPRLKTMVCNKWIKMQLPHIEISDNKGWYHNLTYDNKIWEINAKKFNAFQKTPK